MRTIIQLVPLALLAGAVAAVQACGTVPDEAVSGTAFPPAGVVRGTVYYNGPPPCTQNGQIVGNAIVLVFDRRNPPPPAGVANTAVNFGVVAGDVLFANIPRTTGTEKVCPAAGTSAMLASAPFTVAPLVAGSYLIQAFYDYTGNFDPTFKFLNLPEATDIGGGYVDVNAAEALTSIYGQLPDGGAGKFTAPAADDPNFLPTFLPVDLGTPGPVSPASLRDVPTFTMPDTGYLADNVTVTIGSPLALARPYFYPEGVILPAGQSARSGLATHGTSDSVPTSVVTAANPDGNPHFVPVLQFPQSYTAYATPSLANGIPAQSVVDAFQAGFPQVSLHWGVPAAEQTIAADTTLPADPFHMQLSATPDAGQAPGGNGGIFVWWNDPAGVTDPRLFDIPEGTIPRMWPLIVLAKLEDDPTHTLDPEAITYQGSDGNKPIVIIQAITLLGDSLYDLVLNGAPANYPAASDLQDHVTAMVRPAAVCIDPRHVDEGGTLVVTAEYGSYPPGDTTDSPAPGAPANAPGQVVSPTVINNPQLTQLVKQDGTGFQIGCLPTGRYGINMVYPTGQAWTTPNEEGACAALEGATLSANGKTDPGTCSLKARPVLTSQGTRAVVEITPDTSGACATGGSTGPVPSACTTLTGN